MPTFILYGRTGNAHFLMGLAERRANTAKEHPENVIIASFMKIKTRQLPRTEEARKARMAQDGVRTRTRTPQPLACDGMLEW